MTQKSLSRFSCVVGRHYNDMQYSDMAEGPLFKRDEQHAWPEDGDAVDRKMDVQPQGLRWKYEVNEQAIGLPFAEIAITACRCSFVVVGEANANWKQPNTSTSFRLAKAR